MSLADVLTLKRVRELAGEKAFARGKAYFQEGAVGLLKEESDRVQASVQGTETYRVTLSATPDNNLEYDCTCPVGDSGDFCKHAVAVSLSWLENNVEESFPPEEDAGNVRSGKPRRKRRTQADTLAEYLDTLTEVALKDWLMQAASRDRGMRDKLLLNARAASGGKGNTSGLAALRSAVLKAARQPAFLDWRQAEDFAERLHDAAQLIEDRIPLGEPGLPAIIEETIQQAEASLDNVDDSDGAVQEALHRLGEAHLAACRASNPDPIELAEHLFDIEIAAEWDFYPPALPHYADVLGKEGLNHYRQRVLEAAEKLPVKTMTSINTGPSRYQIERMMEALCQHDGNDAPLLKLLEKNLDSAYRYLQLAERRAASGCHKQALDWAERGLAAFPNEHNSGLIDFLVSLHRKHGDPERASELAWHEFAKAPYFEAYLHLLQHTPGAARTQVRQRAIEYLEALMQNEEAARKKPSKPNAWGSPGTRSTLVQIQLRENNASRVWELASGHAIAGKLWPAVAKMRGESHPDEAVSIYQKLLPDAVRQGQSNARYDEAHELVAAIRALRLNHGKQEQYRQELAALRAEYRAKRNFMKRLESLEP
jgi:uncharacterized Zn finger protein